MRYHTAELCDRYPDRVEVAQPLFRDFGGRGAFHGPIVTVAVFEDNGLVRSALEHPGDWRVLVVDGGGSLRRALLGGELAALAVEKGWMGILINGCVREAAEVARLSLGVKALGTCPMRARAEGAGTAGEPVAFAGLTFVPGHWLYADFDGVVIAEQPLE